MQLKMLAAQHIKNRWRVGEGEIYLFSIHIRHLSEIAIQYVKGLAAQYVLQPEGKITSIRSKASGFGYASNMCGMGPYQYRSRGNLCVGMIRIIK